MKSFWHFILLGELLILFPLKTLMTMFPYPMKLLFKKKKSWLCLGKVTLSDLDIGLSEKWESKYIIELLG